MADVVKYGIQIPNRVFVGGVAFDTKEEDLKDFFTQYGKIKDCKIIKDNQQISRGFAFVTFESKSDAIQTQNLGTVYYNSKKLNLGPAIRQKGVVFNGTKEVENEPVQSTGVYINPSGYSYTVAPNGVWYFHNPDGTPPASTPGSPPLAYTSNIVRKTQLHARKHSLASSTGSSDSPTASDLDNSLPSSQHSPVFSLPGTEISPPPSSTRFIQASPPYQAGSYYSHSPHVVPGPAFMTPTAPYPSGASNIQVAFQNMSISSHVPNGSPQTNTPIHINPIVPQTSSSVNPGAHPMQYTRMTEMYVPFYPNEQHRMVGNSASDQSLDRIPVPCQYQVHPQLHHPQVHHPQVHHPDCHVVSPQIPQMKEGYMYPYYQDNMRQHFVYPSPPQHHVDVSQMYYSEQHPEMYKHSKPIKSDCHTRSKNRLSH